MQFHKPVFSEGWKMETEKKSWMKSLFTYSQGERRKMYLSVALSVVSVLFGLVPFYCMYEVICLFVQGSATVDAIVKWCSYALLAYAVKIAAFSLSTATSHSMAYSVLRQSRTQTKSS